MGIERKVSFSIYRWSLLNSCRRAYYYRYIASWNGWDSTVNQEIKKIYFLKNLVSRENFLSEILKKSFKIYIRERALHNTKMDFPKIAFTEYQKTFNFFFENSKKVLFDGKHRTLSALYYKDQGSAENLNKLLLVELKKIIALITDSSFFREYSETPYIQFRDLNDPESFELDGISVFLSPFLLKVSGNNAEIVLLHLKNFEDVDFWDISSTIAEMFARIKLKIASISCRSLFIREDSLFSVWAARPEIEIKEFVKRGITEIFSFESKTVEIPEPNLTEHCGSCEFREFCS